MKEYRNRTFLIAFNLALLDIALLVWRIAKLDLFGCLLTAVIGAVLYILLRVAVLTMKLEDSLFTEVEKLKPAAEETKEEDQKKE
jgi:hypothetical protein